jgi:hypothetical protein
VSILTDILDTGPTMHRPAVGGATAVVGARRSPKGWRYNVTIEDACSLSNLALERAVGFLVRTGGFTFHQAMTALERAESLTAADQDAPVVITTP